MVDTFKEYAIDKGNAYAAWVEAEEQRDIAERAFQRLAVVANEAWEYYDAMHYDYEEEQIRKN